MKAKPKRGLSRERKLPKPSSLEIRNPGNVYCTIQNILCINGASKQVGPLVKKNWSFCKIEFQICDK